MLRILLLALFSIIATPSFAGLWAKITPTTLTTNADGKYTLERVIDIPGASKAELYKRVKSWVLANVKANDVATTFDEANFDAIAATTTLSIPEKKGSQYANQTMNFKLLIQFKYNKVRILLNNFVYYAFQGYTETRGPFESLDVLPKVAKDVSEKVDAIIPALIANIDRAAHGQDNSNW